MWGRKHAVSAIKNWTILDSAFRNETEKAWISETPPPWYAIQQLKGNVKNINIWHKKPKEPEG